MKSDLSSLLKATAICLAISAYFVGGSVLIGLWAFAIPCFVVAVAILFDTMREDRLDRERDGKRSEQ